MVETPDDEKEKFISQQNKKNRIAHSLARSDHYD